MTCTDVTNIRPFFLKYESRISIKLFSEKLYNIYSELDSHNFDLYLKRINYLESKSELGRSLRHFMIVLEFLSIDESLQIELLKLCKIDDKLAKIITERKHVLRKGVPKLRKGLLNEEQGLLISNYFKRHQEFLYKKITRSYPNLKRISKLQSLKFFNTRNFNDIKEYILENFHIESCEYTSSSSSPSPITTNPKLNSNSSRNFTPRTIQPSHLGDAIENIKFFRPFIKPTRSGRLPMIAETRCMSTI